MGHGHGIRALMVLALAGALGFSLVLFGSLFAVLSGPSASAAACAPSSPDAVDLPPGGGAWVGATEYGGWGDPSSGTVGSSGVDLLSHPDSYAELGGTSFATATALGGLAYGTPLRITWGGHSLIAQKEDIGLGGGPIDGRPRVIDLWWQFATALGIPYEDGRWSGTVRIERPPSTGAGVTLGAVPASVPLGAHAQALACAAGLGVNPADGASVPGVRAERLPDGLAVAPAQAPAQVRAMIAAGNQIVNKPYVYGGGHGEPLSQIAAGYDCSSSVSHLLWGGGLIAATDGMTSGELMSWGEPGPGRWVTIYASPDHVFMYVAGLRWDTWNAAGPGDGTAGIGWHPLVRGADGFVVRHPEGL